MTSLPGQGEMQASSQAQSWAPETEASEYSLGGAGGRGGAGSAGRLYLYD